MADFVSKNSRGLTNALFFMTIDKRVCNAKGALCISLCMPKAASCKSCEIAIYELYNIFLVFLLLYV